MGNGRQRSRIGRCRTGQAPDGGLWSRRRILVLDVAAYSRGTAVCNSATAGDSWPPAGVWLLSARTTANQRTVHWDTELIASAPFCGAHRHPSAVPSAHAGGPRLCTRVVECLRLGSIPRLHNCLRQPVRPPEDAACNARSHCVRRAMRAMRCAALMRTTPCAAPGACPRLCCIQCVHPTRHSLGQHPMGVVGFQVRGEGGGQ